MNNTTQSLDSDTTSLINLLNRMPADITFIIVGSFTVFVNFLIILTIAKSKRLRTRCYFLIANVSVAAIIFCGSFALTGLKRIIRYKLWISEVQTKLACNGEMFICYFGQSACASLPVTTAIDRLFATLAPVKYKNIGTKFVVILTSLGWLYAVLDSSTTFLGANMKSTVLNCNLVSTTDILYAIQSSCAIALAMLLVIIYICVLTVLQYQIKNAKIKSENMAEVKAKLQMKVAKSLSVDSGVHLLTQVGTRVGLALLPLFPDANKWTSASYMRIIIFAGLASTFFVFLTLNKEFRKSFLRLLEFIPCVKNQVKPIEMETNFNTVRTVRIGKGVF